MFVELDVFVPTMLITIVDEVFVVTVVFRNVTLLVSLVVEFVLVVLLALAAKLDNTTETLLEVVVFVLDVLDAPVRVDVALVLVVEFVLDVLVVKDMVTLVLVVELVLSGSGSGSAKEILVLVVEFVLVLLKDTPMVLFMVLVVFVN